MAVCSWALLACFLVLFSYTACLPTKKSTCIINQEHVNNRPNKVFNCSITNGQEASEIVWKINGVTIKKSEGPIHWVGLEIPDKSLSGTLRCEAKTGKHYTACQIPLTGFPKIASHVSIYDTYIGHQIVVPCKATGSPQPTLTWTKRNSALTKSTMPKSVRLQRSHDSLDMVIDKVSKADSGIYLCQAVNHVGVDTHFAVISVHYNEVHTPPRVVAVQSTITVQSGHKAVLLCTTEYTTKALTALYWDHGQVRIKNNTRLHQKEKYSFEAIGGMYKVGRAAMSLVIKETAPSDAGLYTCGAVTHIGQSQAQVQLIITE